ncbi:MAG: acylphosphatase [bacterium]
MKALLLIIEGKVQGVGMRYFIRKNALKLNLSGYAKNLPNGKVESLIIGEPENVDQIIELIKNNSPGVVKNIDVIDYDGDFKRYVGKFEIM